MPRGEARVVLIFTGCIKHSAARRSHPRSTQRQKTKRLEAEVASYKATGIERDTLKGEKDLLMKRLEGLLEWDALKSDEKATLLASTSESAERISILEYSLSDKVKEVNLLNRQARKVDLEKRSLITKNERELSDAQVEVATEVAKHQRIRNALLAMENECNATYDLMTELLATSQEKCFELEDEIEWLKSPPPKPNLPKLINPINQSSNQIYQISTQRTI